MLGIMARRPLRHRILTWDNRETDFSGEAAINISDTIFSFLDEEGQGSSLESVSDDVNYVEDENEEKENSENVEDSQFWETQHQLLQSVLCRTTSLESQLRSITKETIKEAKHSAENGCSNCSWKMVNNGCHNCLMKEVCSRLQNAGFNAAICNSKWRSSPDIPSGNCPYSCYKASEEYNRLVKCLPEVFVGKIERLMSVIKILCNAAKKCMKEKKMHMGPWRKQKYMQAKWLKTSERVTAKPQLSTDEYYSSRLPRPKTSMLTVDLLENFPSLNRTAVEVV
uniref:Uncharacterized protein LOC104242005 n=1 Tax=Nicotiana sylvestris TaxID=4096 RepID=A0A1U7Y8W8_NICSY|nr:PREDICTED: uncharacterized protein LOC104242005 [Nicotiana sylvestris]